MKSPALGSIHRCLTDPIRGFGCIHEMNDTPFGKRRMSPRTAAAPPGRPQSKREHTWQQPKNLQESPALPTFT